MILETETRADQTFLAAKLLELWRDNIFEDWRDQADLVLLQVCRRVGALFVEEFLIVVLGCLRTNKHLNHCLKRKCQTCGCSSHTNRKAVDQSWEVA
jgi:deoxycytidylate deaminase